MTVSEYKFFTGHGTGINNLCLGLRDLGYEMAIGAMSCGKPVVLSDIPVHKEIIEKSKGGKIFQISDKKSLSIMIEKCIENSKEIVKNGRKFAEENDWTNVSKKVAMIYNELL